jgi:hypothetical protein
MKRSTIAGATFAAFIAFAMGGCVVLGCKLTDLCLSDSKNAAAWVRSEVRTGMTVPQLVELAEASPRKEEYWRVSLEECAQPRHDFSMSFVAGRNAYLGQTRTIASSGEAEWSHQAFATREELFAALPSHVGCRGADIEFPHWRVPMELDAAARVERVFDIVYFD